MHTVHIHMELDMGAEYDADFILHPSGLRECESAESETAIKALEVASRSRPP